MKAQYDVIVIGGGPAGLASALAARENGAKKVLIIERDKILGGILNQCIHNGFGLHHFGQELTGPEYAGRFIGQIKDSDIQVMTDTMVLKITPDKTVYAVNTDGVQELSAGAIILTTGCRERTRGALRIPGDRPAGVFTAGSAQRYVNMDGYLPGSRVVILGSGDIGLIMARRMSLEGAKVLACVELMPYSNGLERNIVQCLQDYDIPLFLSHTITRITGKNRVESVTIAAVDENREPIPGTEQIIECDCVLLSVGLIPENELGNGAGLETDPATKGPVVFENMETSVPGIFAAGNVVHVHDLADFVTDESERAGKAAGAFVCNGEAQCESSLKTIAGAGIGYVVPGRIRNHKESVLLSFRVKTPARNCQIRVYDGDVLIARFVRDVVQPSQMERVTIPAVLMKKVKGDCLEVRLEA